MDKDLFKVALIGRVNVGKSSLFNLLTESKKAIISSIAGTTRDLNEGLVEWDGCYFWLIDTGGLNIEKPKNSLEKNVRQQAQKASKTADLILFVVDSKEGILPQDIDIIKRLKQEKKEFILVANKADSPKQRIAALEFSKIIPSHIPLIPVSAANGSGTGDLLDVIKKRIPHSKCPKSINLITTDDIINIAIIGKPNVGKSSLLNALLGYEKVIVNPQAHTTREPRDTFVKYKNNTLRLIDTAGIRRKTNKSKDIESQSVEKTKETIKQSDIVLFVIDIKDGITMQERKIAGLLKDAGTSIIIIANKYDLIPKGSRDQKNLKEYIYGYIPFLKWAPILFVSAKNKLKIQKIFPLILDIYNKRNTIITDNALDKFLKKLIKQYPPQKAKGTKHPHIYHLKQLKTAPPIFEIKIGLKDNLAKSYIKFIENSLRKKFQILATPIKIIVKKAKII